MQPTLEQQNIIQHVDGHALVYAVAGAGKTTTMIQRILHLIRQAGVRPNRILACTFSREAARTIEERLARHPETAGVLVCTLHSLAFRILQEAQRLGLTNVRQGEEHFSRRLFQQARTELIEEDEAERRAYFDIKFDDFNTYLSVQKASLRLPYVPHDLPDWAQALISPPDRGVDLYANLYVRHDEHRRREAKLDFDDSIVEAWLLMARFPALRENMAKRWDFLHVDEFQDVNLAQSEMLDLLGAHCRSYTVIGDDDQTIYQWRGANPRFILGFAQRYGARTFTLSSNFRCPMGVIALADRVIQRNTVREPKRLKATRGGNGVILHEHAPGKAAHVAIQALDQGHSPRDIVILVRTYAQTGEIEQVFLEKEIPYLVVGGVPFYRRQEVAVLLAYLRLALADLDAQRGVGLEAQRQLSLLKDWKLVANSPNRFLRRQVVDEIGRRAWRQGRSLAQVVREASGSLTRSAQGMMEGLGQALENLTDDLALSRGKEALLEFADALAYTDHLINTAPTREFGEERAGSVRALAEMAQERSLGELVTYITTLGQQARYEERYSEARQGDDVPRVTLMTAFRAKGLEWPVVIVPDCKAGLYRVKESADQAAAEEERRVFYVALTRAQRELHLVVDEHDPTPFLTAVAHERVVFAHARLMALMTRDPASWSARETYEAAELLGEFEHEPYVQLWLDAGYRSRVLGRMEQLRIHLDGSGTSAPGLPRALGVLSLQRYAQHGALDLAADLALTSFGDLSAVLQALQEDPNAGPQGGQPSAAGLDALGRQPNQAGSALSPADLRVGLAVQHKRFGRGTVVALQGQGQAMQASVRFDAPETEKKMVVIYANLQAVPEWSSSPEKSVLQPLSSVPMPYVLYPVPEEEDLPF